ncbi:MAG: selenoneine biosynthesis selenosugar synthase SenB [Candidatus Binatia bacterium]
MHIKLITPAPPDTLNGNRVTAMRWARMLRQLGHRLVIEQHYNGGSCDLMIALHALRSFDSIHRFREQRPKAPLIVVLTGTDLYRDIRTNPNAQQSLKLATRLVVLQSMGLEELPRQHHPITRVIYQSAEPANGGEFHTGNGFKVCVIGHLRLEKDPLRTAMAVRHLPTSSRLQVSHIGRALSHHLKKRILAEVSRNPRYRWLGGLPHWRTRKILAGSHLMALTSRIEGSSNVLSEALASSVPIVASRIPGLVGTLGKDYPGYFSVGNTHELTWLLRRVETDRKFYKQLKTSCARLRRLVTPERELACWKRLLSEVSKQ